MAGSRERTRWPGIYRLESGLWQVLFRVDGQQRSQSFETLKQARDFQTRTKAAIAQGTWIDPAGGKVKLWEWVALWLETRRVSPATTARTEWALNRHLLPRFGERPLGSIRPREVQLWVQELEGKGLARGSVAKCYTLLAQIMAGAVNEDLIARSPCRGIRFDPATPAAREARALTTEEAARLLAALAGSGLGAAGGRPNSDSLMSPGVRDRRSPTPTPYTLVLTLLGTGLRFGEAAGLRRQRVQLLRRPPTIEVLEALHEVNGRLSFGPPKTRSSLRTIPLPSVVAQALAAHLPPNGDPADLVFRSPRGQPLRRTNFSAGTWLPATKLAGLAGLRVHDLRHSYASVLENHGVPRAITAELLGHSSSGPGQTSGYTHAWQQTINEAVGVVDAWLRVVVGGEEGRWVGG